ncbi:membrane alanyl aminopeptidase-like isoform X2 [Eurosta solidaginis]|uniref:membrane alanyl aminopeptidase-like isoform X2 n=1 Tax=Eurosta solidaginis TaxID=178769 RepID=UPI003530D21C
MMCRLYLAATLVVFLGFRPGRAVGPDGNDYRLPLETRPWNYNIKLTPYLLETDGSKRFTFDGEVTIKINSTVNTKTLTLLSKNLNYTTSEYWAAVNTKKVDLGSGTVNSVTSKIQYNLTTELVAGKTYFLHFVYNGSMNDDMIGFYRSYYVDSNNVTRWIGATQFEANEASRAFPSFDEPKFKATFDLTIRRPRHYNTFSNTRISKTINYGDYQDDVYVTTPRMSTYLLAFIVSEFTQRNNGKFGVISRPEYYDQTEYSFNVGQKILNKLESYFGINYYNMGIDKMHMAAIPDFAAGAMENWGLLSFKERGLLYDVSSTTLNAKQSIAALIAHEQTHMWFGDLVTCDWWSYTWLNEGFARYFQYFGSAMVETKLGLDQQFVFDQVQSVMLMDSTNCTNPMSDENTNTAADINRMFNSITYSKGATFIRMIKYAMGEESFKASLQAYLKKNQYKNTVPANLFKVWFEHWPEDTKQFAEAVFNGFTKQVGYPLITVKLSDDKKFYSIKQERFLLRDQEISDTSLLYTVPLSYTTSNAKNFRATAPKFYLNPSKSEEKFSLDSKVEWVIFNIQQSGYYRVNYDESNWLAIKKALASDNWGGIHLLNRAQIVDDLFNLARANVIEYDLALKILEYLATEIEYVPWSSAFSGYSYIHIRFGGDIQSFAEYILELTDKAYKELGFDELTSDTASDIYTRDKILSWSCQFGNVDCIEKSKKHFAKIDTTAVPVNIRSVVYCNALRYGNESDYDTLFQKFLKSNSATEKTLIISSLGCVKNIDLIEKYFWAIISDDIRRQDKASALSSLYTSNNENVAPVFKLVTDNFEKLATSLGDHSKVASAISDMASRFTKESEQQSLTMFNQKNKLKFGSSVTTLEASEKTVEENLAWAKARLGSFKTYLDLRKINRAAKNSFTLQVVILCSVFGLFL